MGTQRPFVGVGRAISFYRQSFYAHCLCLRQNRFSGTQRESELPCFYSCRHTTLLSTWSVNSALARRVGKDLRPNPKGHEVFSPPAGAEVSGLESCPKRRGDVMSDFGAILFVPCERAERPAGPFVWKFRSIQSCPVVLTQQTG